jgi:hypothetical protein
VILHDGLSSNFASASQRHTEQREPTAGKERLTNRR